MESGSQRAAVSAQPRISTPYPAAAATVLCVIGLAEVIAVPGPVDATFLASLIGLALGLGSAWGLTFGFVQARLASAPRPVSFALWTALGFAIAYGVADALGGFSHLTGRYQDMAIVVLCATAIGALSLAALLCGYQPTRDAPDGWLLTLPRRPRVALALVQLAGAIVATIADRYLYAGLYVVAHTALRCTSAWLVIASLVLCEPELRFLRPARAVIAFSLALILVPATLLTEHRQEALEGFSARIWPEFMLSAARTLADVDLDGYSALFAGGDCAPFDPAVHPLAREIPDNLIDDNCMSGDAHKKVEAIEHLPTPSEPSPLDVVLITIDALRPDHLGIYNPEQYGPGGRNTTPKLDHWARSATVFERAYTAGGWTSISIPSLMRGMYARRLQWTRYYETNLYAMIRAPLAPQLRTGERVERVFPFAYQDQHAPLAVRFKRRGMFTAAIVDDGYSEILKRGTGIELGFDVFRMTDSLPGYSRNDSGTVNNALSTLRQLPSSQRFFMWVHLFGPHVPTELHPNTRIYGKLPIDGYDHEVAYLDGQLARLLDALGNLQHPVAVFIAADHGEHFELTARFHGYSLDEDQIRVPLIARVPGWPARRVPGTFSLIDLVPTMLALTKTPAPSNLDGEDLSAVALGATPHERMLLTDTWRFEGGKPTADYVSAVNGRRKVVFDRLRHHLSQYDLRVGDTFGEPVDDPATDLLARRIYDYVEDTGGELARSMSDVEMA